VSELEIIQPHEVADAIAQERESMEFRPTAMILAHTVLDPETGLISFASVMSSKDKSEFKPWWFPQGGLDEGETPEQAASRELFEEIKRGIKRPVSPERFTILGAIRDPSSKPRDGYKANGKGGKLLIAGSAPVKSKGKLIPNPKENIAKASWFEADQLQEIFAANIKRIPRKELKARFSIAMINLALENLAK
jgi:8-oxo-dGTP pyrophosphatase MutT (NUDIX family)